MQSLDKYSHPPVALGSSLKIVVEASLQFAVPELTPILLKKSHERAEMLRLIYRNNRLQS